MKKPLTIIIPTWNNEQFLNPCVVSIIKTGVLQGFADLLIINNGKQDIERIFGNYPGIRVIDAKGNLGWEGGLELGMKNCDTEFVVFQNDDTFIPPISHNFYQKLMVRFNDRNVAAVGPTTTVAAGVQSIFHPNCPYQPIEVSYLIFFTVMVRRSHYEAVGGIDTTLPGGDDFDLSIRFRKKGYNIVVDPNAFIIHHGFKSGTRLKGDPTTKGGWNSPEMTDRTNQYLIRKHGLKAWWKAMAGLDYSSPGDLSIDKEGDIIRSFVNGEKNIVEMGCGGKKTIENSIGVDRIPPGEKIPHLNGVVSVADIVSDVSGNIPLSENSQDIVIARHILEHCPDTIGTIKEWKRIIRPGGRLLIAVPDENITRGIPLNPEHCHVFTKESLKNLMEACGLREVKSQSSDNGVSFVGCYERMN